MAIATIGRIQEFDSSKEEWPQYVERLGHFFTANGITTADRKKAVLLTVIGPTTYQLLRSLIAPDKPGNQSYANIVETLTNHFRPTPSEIIERYKFHSRFRKPGESVATYVSELRRLTEFCNFGDTLEVNIRDQIVLGINDEAIQKRLFSETKLTYKRAVELSQSLERAAENLKELKIGEQDPTAASKQQEVHKVSSTPTAVGKSVSCFRCGNVGHIAPKCRVSKNVTCIQCEKTGHMQKACRGQSKQKRKPKKHYLPQTVCRVQDDEDKESASEEEPMFHVSQHGKERIPPIVVKVKVDDCLISMEVDTGASMSLMSETTFKSLWPGRSLQSTEVRLCSYSKESIPVVGCCHANIAYKDQRATKMPLVIVQGSGPSLLGRDWLSRIRLDWREIHHVRTDSLQAVLDRYPTVFQDGLGTFKGVTAKIYVDKEAPPKFCRSRPVPYALREKVEQELQCLQEEGTLERVEMADWAAPIVSVVKADKTSVRICGDFRLTVNPVSKLDKYPIPRVEDLFASMEKGKYYTKLDLSQAYQQILLDEDSKKYVVINTHRGLFRYTRLPFGLSSAPGIFQRAAESLLQGIRGVVVYFDDILVTGRTEKEHLEALEEVLRRLDGAGLRLKQKKCQFMKPSVTYLGYKIDEAGLHLLEDKVQAIKGAPTPQSVQQLKAYLGLLSYYSKFLPNLSSTLHPFYKLLQKDFPWKWGAEQKKAFSASKELLTSEAFLVHFDSTKKLTLACDASAYGVGAVLAHKMPDGSERPIGYASHTLNKSERNYSQLEKEGLSCIFGIKKFHNYLFGHQFELVTDHKPLLGLLKEDRPTSPQASARIKRWSLFLAGYEYTLTFRNTKAHANADALSRLPLPVEPAQTETPPELVLLAEHLADSPVTADDIRVWTGRDPKLSRVMQHIQQGWPTNGDSDLGSYSAKRTELSTYEGCILWGTRVIIPEPGREAVIQELHEGHPGMTRMKALARMYVWWPGIDAEIEKSVQLCEKCQEMQSSPPLAPLNPWKWPTRPWARLHLDFAGPLEGKMFLILIDAHSKWIEAVATSSTSSNVVIEELHTVFAKFGIPETIVTDNGSGFVSKEFETFLKKNGIRHTTSAPYHPASNGLAERAVQIVKKGLKKVTTGTVNSRLSKILFAYRITPQTTTGVSPSELLLGRRPRSKLDLMKPHTAERVERKQSQQKAKHDATAKPRKFHIGDPVYLKDHTGSRRWLAGKIVKETGPVSFHVQLQDGQQKRCHQDQLRVRVVESDITVTSDNSGDARL